MEVVITAATIATIFFNLTSSSEQNGYSYNAQMDNGKVETMNVYCNDANILTNKYRYSYTYDSYARLTQKTVQKWNGGSEEWVNDYVLTYEYNDFGYVLSFCKWNKDKKSYNRAGERMEYKLLGHFVMSENTYRWNESENNYVLVSKVLVMTPENVNYYTLSEKAEKLMEKK